MTIFIVPVNDIGITTRFWSSVFAFLQKAYITKASPAQALEISAVLQQSIKQCCVADHGNDRDKLRQWLDNKTPDDVLSWINRVDTYCLCAIIEPQQIIGFSMVTNAGEILLCYLMPGYHQQGYGKLMLQGIESYLQSIGVNEVYLESTQAAQSFYLANGFTSCNAIAARGDLRCYQMRKTLTKYGVLGD